MSNSDLRDSALRRSRCHAFSCDFFWRGRDLSFVRLGINSTAVMVLKYEVIH